MNEQETKRAYNEKIIQIDHGMFAPLVFSINDSLGRQRQNFYLLLAQLKPEKRDLPQSILSNGI